MSPDETTPDVPEEVPAAESAENQETTISKVPDVTEAASQETTISKVPEAEEPEAAEAETAEAVVEETPAEDPVADEPEAPSKRRGRKPKVTAEVAKPAEKAKPARKGATPERRAVVRAQAKYVRTSARKARMVCGHIRGKSIDDARAILAFTPRDVARDWSKLLESAVANAENNHELVGDDLIVHEAYADEGPTIKRFRPRAMGRATPIRKRTSHLTITLTPRS
jgi:ribosomal protein L22